jgi:hypothetical protein
LASSEREIDSRTGVRAAIVLFISLTSTRFKFQAYQAFSKAVGQFTTLPLVIHNKELIFERLKEHIGNKEELALESLFDLCAAFALDLQVNNTKTSPYPWILQVNVQQNVFAVKQVFTFFIGATN